MTLLRLSLIALFGLGLVNCSMPTDVKDTKDTSRNIEKYSKSLDDNSLSLKTDSHYIADGTGKIFGGARKDLGFERPNERFRELMDAKSDTARIRYATALCTSFEFQQWSGTGDDTVKKKNQMYAKAIRDFFVMFEGVINRNYVVDTAGTLGIPTPPDDRWKTLAAVAVAMSEIDPDQQAASDANHIDAESIYSLIVKGLGYKSKVNSGNAAPEFAKQVLDWEDEAVFLLQLRHNFFPAMVLSRFSNFGVGGSVEQGKDWFLGLNIDLPANSAKIQDQGITWLMASLETEGNLMRLGYGLEFNKGIIETLAGTKFQPPPAAQATPDLLKKIDELNARAQDIAKIYQTGKLP